MNLLHLHYFYTVAKEGGFLKASKVLRIQQPAISRMVQQLEDNLGFKLFEKVGRNVRLTNQGREVFERSQRIFGEVENLQMAIGEISGECKGPLMIGASEPIASHFIPSLLHAFLQKHPKVYPNVFSATASTLFEKLMSGKVEMGLFFHTPDLPENLEVASRLETRFHLVIRKDLKNDKKTLQSFIGSREIDDTSTSKFPTLDRLRKDHPQAKITISSNNLTAHKNMVLQGLGLSILPDFLIKEDLKSGALVEVYPKETFVFNMKVIKRRTAPLSLNAREFLASFKK